MTAHSIPSLHPLYEQQLALEEEMIGNGKKRFFAAVEKAKQQTNEAGTVYGTVLMKRLIDPITAGIRGFIEEAGSGRAGPKHRALAYIQLMEPQVVAYLTLKSLLDTISKRSTIQRAALRIANALQDEVLMSRYKRADKREYERTLEHLKDSTSTRHKRTVARLMAKTKAGVTMEWGDTDKVLLGTKLCEIVRATTGLIAIERDTVAANDTPEQSLYNLLPERGYEVRVWPVRVPSEKQMAAYGDRLAPMVSAMLERGITVGETTEPRRFSNEDLREREASYGRAGFALQFMLDTRLSDADRYPLKVADLIVMSVNPEMAPARIIWAADPNLVINDLPNVSFTGDRFHRPMWSSDDYTAHLKTGVTPHEQTRGRPPGSHRRAGGRTCRRGSYRPLQPEIHGRDRGGPRGGRSRASRRAG